MRAWSSAFPAKGETAPPKGAKNAAKQRPAPSRRRLASAGRSGNRRSSGPIATIRMMVPVQRGAAAGGALFAIDQEGMLEIAERAVGLAMIAQGRAAGGDRLLQNGADRGGKSFGLGGRLAACAGDRAGLAQRRQAGAMKGFADIDIAEAGDEALIEQRGLQRRSSGRRTAAPEPRRRNRRRAARCRALRNSGWAARSPDGASCIEAEAARVVIDDARAVRQMKDDMVMRRVLRALEMEGARAFPSLAVSMRNEPDMPRCMISVSPLSSAARIYFARRDRFSTRRPARRSAKRSGKGKRKPARRSSILSIFASTSTGARPRRTVSTSGISGIGMALDDCEKRRAVFLQLGDADAVDGGEFFEISRPARRHFDQCAVGKNDIGRLMLAMSEIAAQRLQRIENAGARLRRAAPALRPAGAASSQRRLRATKTAPRRAEPSALAQSRSDDRDRRDHGR